MKPTKITFIRPLTHFKNGVYLAFSGGIDSMVLLDILLKRRFNVTLLWVDHHTENCITEKEFLFKIANKYNIPFVIKEITNKNVTKNKECVWSVDRNSIFQHMDKPVLTGHHLDDAVEWYLMSTFQGTIKLLDYNNRNVYRPLILINKECIIHYASMCNLDYITDPTNMDNSFNIRNKVRNLLLPRVKECFIGINKTVKKLIIKKEFSFKP